MPDRQRARAVLALTPGEGWYAARRELAVATGLVVALAVATWALLGPAAASIVTLICAGLGTLALRALLPHHDRAAGQPNLYYEGPTTSFAGFWRMQTDLSDAIASMSAWDVNTRRRLQNLLAARLAERHGISLADDPAAARAIFVGSPERRGLAELWYWIDPKRPVSPDATSSPGIPHRALVALIQRLEQL
jgi:hypothetical protein